MAAPDVPHHGALDRRGSACTPLRAYRDAVGRTAAGLDPRLLIVGHSLGGFVVATYLEPAAADLAVLRAPSPLGVPGRLLLCAWRMASRHPAMVLKTLRPGNLTDPPERTRACFVTPVTPADVVEQGHSRLQPESRRILLDMMPALRPERIRTPVVVLGAADDQMVRPHPSDGCGKEDEPWL